MKNIYLFIFMILSVSAWGQSVTFQSYMQTAPWAEQVLLNGDQLIETSPGVFEIVASNVLPGKNIIEFVSFDSGLNGVSTLDLVIIMRAISDVEPLLPNAKISGDVNGSNFVGVEDLVSLRGKILGWETTNEFRMVHPSVDLNVLDIFDFGSDVYKFCFEGSDLSSIDFTFDIYQSGDVNKNANLKPNDTEVSEVRSENLVLSFDDLDISAEENLEIPFTLSADTEIAGLQFALANKGFVIESIEVDSYDHTVHFNNSREDETRVVFLSENPSKEIKGTIIGKGKKNAKLSDIISISADFKDEVVYSNLNLSGVSLEFESLLSNDNLSLNNLVISPNPVQDYFSIQIPRNLLDRSTFTITNPQGQVVMNRTNLKDNLVVDRDDLGATGIYIITWTYRDKSIHQKLIVQ